MSNVFKLSPKLSGALSTLNHTVHSRSFSLHQLTRLTSSSSTSSTNHLSSLILLLHCGDMSIPSSSSYDQSSSWRRNPSFPSTGEENKLEESDEDMFTVPDVEARPSDSTTGGASEVQQSNSSDGKRRRGRNPADREYRRLKRLLRNRVSAQQARERKKVYVNDLESKADELQDKNSKLEEKISTLSNENTMLRKILMNTRPKVDESVEPKPSESDKS